MTISQHGYSLPESLEREGRWTVRSLSLVSDRTIVPISLLLFTREAVRRPQVDIRPTAGGGDTR
jgi:hypothetical protein